MSKLYEKLETCLASVRQKTDFKPEVALILGSGIGDYADEIKIETTIDYTDIEGFPTSTVAGHKGRFVFGYVGNVPVVIMQGRVRYYEGYPMTDVVLPTRLMGMMGAKKLILTNAAGGANPEYKPGDFMMITDHITTGVPSPLIGENIYELGARFPDMSEVYSLRLQDVIFFLLKMFDEQDNWYMFKLFYMRVSLHLRRMLFTIKSRRLIISYYHTRLRIDLAWYYKKDRNIENRRFQSPVFCAKIGKEFI